MAWEDRSKAEKREAKRAAAERAKIDDRHNTYEVTEADGTKFTCAGEIDAKILAGKTGTYRRK